MEKIGIKLILGCKWMENGLYKIVVYITLRLDFM
jgi:hypothetical protein